MEQIRGLGGAKVMLCAGSAELGETDGDAAAADGPVRASSRARRVVPSQHLPEVVGDTAWYRQYGPGGGERYRSSAEKAREVANTWRHAGNLMHRLLGDAQMYATTAKKAHSGAAARAFHYFKNTIGFGDPPEHAQEHEPLVANLVAACMQLSKACEKYADHIEHANIQILNHKAEPFRIEAPWDSPMLGGNGDDGGLHSAVTHDGHIHRLGDVAHALDSAQAKVRLPGGLLTLRA